MGRDCYRRLAVILPAMKPTIRPTAIAPPAHSHFIFPMASRIGLSMAFSPMWALRTFHVSPSLMAVPVQRVLSVMTRPSGSV